MHMRSQTVFPTGGNGRLLTGSDTGWTSWTRCHTYRSVCDMFSLQDRFRISNRYYDCVMPLERHRVMDMRTDGSCVEAEGAYNKSAGGCTIVGRQGDNNTNGRSSSNRTENAGMVVGGSTPHIVRASCCWQSAIMPCSTLPVALFLIFRPIGGEGPEEVPWVVNGAAPGGGRQ